jgi:hypothetical protein
MSISFIGRKISTKNNTIASKMVKNRAQNPTIYPHERPDFILTSIFGVY